MFKFDQDYIDGHLGLEDLSTVILLAAMEQMGNEALDSVQLTANITVFPTERSCVGICIGINDHKICLHKVNEQIALQ